MVTTAVCYAVGPVQILTRNSPWHKHLLITLANVPYIKLAELT